MVSVTPAITSTLGPAVAPAAPLPPPAAAAGRRPSTAGLLAVGRPPSINWVALRALTLATLVPLQVAAGSLLLYREAYTERIYPRIAIMDVAVGGQTPAQARATLEGYIDGIAQRPLLLTAGGTQVTTTLGDLGLTPPTDAARLVDRAWNLGRVARPAGWLLAQWDLLRRGERLPLDLGLDRDRGRDTLAQLSAALDRPPVDAALALEPAIGRFVLRATPAQAGATVDVEATLDRLQAALWQGIPDRLEVALAPIAPAVTNEQIAPAQTLAARLLAGPLVFRRDATHQWDVPPTALAAALRIVPAVDGAPAGETIGFDEGPLADLIAGVAAQADVPAQNPRLEVQGDRLAVVPGKAGQLVDREAALGETAARLAAGQRTISLPMIEDRPWVAESDLARVRDWANTRLALPLTLDYNGQRWGLDRRDVAASLVLPDTQALARPGLGQHTPPVPEVRLDAAKLRDALAHTVPYRIGLDPGQTAADAALEVRDHLVQIRPARAGTGVDFDALAADLAGRFGALDPAARVAPLPVGPLAPRLSEARLAPAREQAERLIGKPVVVRDAFQEWPITPDDLAAMLKIQDSGGQVSAYLGRDQLLAQVERIAREAEARTGPNAVRDGAGHPAKVDRLLTASAVWAAAQADQPEQRVADLQWADAG